MSSFYKKELKKIKELIKEPLIELVIEHLPHLQSSQKEKDDAWEIIAIKLNKQLFRDNFNNYKRDPKDSPEMLTLNGMIVSEFYEDLIKNIYLWTVDSNGQSHRRMAYDRMTCMLQSLKAEEYYDVEVKMKLSKERFDEQQRKKYENSAFDLDNAMHNYTIQDNEQQDETTGDGYKSTISEELRGLKDSEKSDKIEILESEMVNMQKRLEFIERENKRLLELNHELVLQINGRRS